MDTYVAALAITGMALQAIFIAVEHREKYVPAVILMGLLPWFSASSVQSQ